MKSRRSQSKEEGPELTAKAAEILCRETEKSAWTAEGTRMNI